MGSLGDWRDSTVDLLEMTAERLGGAMRKMSGRKMSEDASTSGSSKGDKRARSSWWRWPIILCGPWLMVLLIVMLGASKRVQGALPVEMDVAPPGSHGHDHGAHDHGGDDAASNGDLGRFAFTLLATAGPCSLGRAMPVAISQFCCTLIQFPRHFSSASLEN